MGHVGIDSVTALDWQWLCIVFYHVLHSLLYSTFNLIMTHIELRVFNVSCRFTSTHTVSDFRVVLTLVKTHCCCCFIQKSVLFELERLLTIKAKSCKKQFSIYIHRYYTTSCLRVWRKIANLCLSLDADNCVRRTSTRVLHSEPTHVLAIAHSLLLDLAYGTVCQPSCENQTLHSDSFDEHSKRIYL